MWSVRRWRGRFELWSRAKSVRIGKRRRQVARYENDVCRNAIFLRNIETSTQCCSKTRETQSKSNKLSLFDNLIPPCRPSQKARKRRLRMRKRCAGKVLKSANRAIKRKQKKMKLSLLKKLLVVALDSHFFMLVGSSKTNWRGWERIKVWNWGKKGITKRCYCYFSNKCLCRRWFTSVHCSAIWRRCRYWHFPRCG